MRMIRLTGFDDESIRVAVDAVVSVTSVRRTGATVVSLKNGETHEVLQNPGMVAAMIEEADRASEGPVERSGCVRCADRLLFANAGCSPESLIGVLLLACGLGAALVAWRNRR